MDKKLHSADWASAGAALTFLQKVDYRYNIRGWLTNINDRNLSNGASVEGQVSDPDGSSVEPDLFGMDIRYNDNLQLGATAQFNGNIAEAMWKTRKPITATGSDPANILRGYAYSYDRASRITGAQYRTYEGGVWGNTSTDFTVSGIDYDGNGNLRHMNRKGTTNGSDTSPVKGTLDELTYVYTPATGNQLLAVDDSPAGNSNTATHDFKDNGRTYATTGIEYRYDDSGNLLSDANKNISGIGYSRMNQPVTVDITSKGVPNHIEYTYTATGTKLQKRLFVNGNGTGTPTTVTDYAGPFVYEGTTSSAAAPTFVQTAEGRALFTTSTALWKYEYHLKDHLGNLRYAFRADRDAGAETQAHAGMEPANAAEEEKQFQHVAETRLADPDRARTGSFVARLNARQGRRLGPTITLPVAAGDSVHAEVYGRYDHGGALGGLLPKGAVVTGAAVAIGAGQAGSDQTVPKVGQRRIWPLLGASIGFVPQLFKARVAELPAAYLRYELFNKDSQLVATHLQPLVRTATDEWQRLSVGTKADSAGYVRLSLANESGVAAYFDDMAARGVAPTPYQENHYDPFGLNLVGIEAAQSPSNSRFQYNGKEKQEDGGLNWNDFGARMHDSQIGRWHSIDPMAEKNDWQSPYCSMDNNPIANTDPTGMESIN